MMRRMKNPTRKQVNAELALTDVEIEKLDTLYVSDGAWTPQEACAAFGTQRTEELEHLGVLGRCDTDMGPMYLLLAKGRVKVFGTSGNAQSLARQIDRAYVRLSLKKLNWTENIPDETLENLCQYDTTNRMVVLAPFWCTWSS